MAGEYLNDEVFINGDAPAGPLTGAEYKTMLRSKM
jgi:hypothetical protein